MFIISISIRMMIEIMRIVMMAMMMVVIDSEVPLSGPMALPITQSGTDV